MKARVKDHTWFVVVAYGACCSGKELACQVHGTNELAVWAGADDNV